MRTYSFTAVCNSGETKTTSFTALNWQEARQILQQFIENN